MDTRKFARSVAAAFLGIGVATASTADAKPPLQDITVSGVDPIFQRRISYDDLNLVTEPDQRLLKYRISRAAGKLCLDVNGWDDGSCRRLAIVSTRDQVKQAIARAGRKTAGLAVGPPIAISMVIGIQ